MARHILLSLAAIVLASVLGMGTAHAAGYAHYWMWKKAPTPDAVAKCAADMRKVMDARRTLLAVEAEEAGTETVFFNGIRSEAHEPFVFPGDTGVGGSADGALEGFNICRTQWKPYDEVVTACLLVARDHFPADVLEIASDGTFTEWQAGARLYEHVMKRTARSPLMPPGSVTAPRPAQTVATPVVSPASAKPDTAAAAAAASAMSRRQWLFVLIGAAVGILILMAVPTRK